MNNIMKLTATASMALVLTACVENSTSSGSSFIGGQFNSPTEGSTCTLTDANGVMHTAPQKTNDNGVTSFNITTLPHGVTQMSCVGGDYIDEQNGTTKHTVTVAQRAATNYTGGALNLYVSPLSDMAVKLAENTGAGDLSNIDVINGDVAEVFGLSADFISKVPVNFNEAENGITGSAVEDKLGMVLANISAKDAASGTPGATVDAVTDLASLESEAVAIAAIPSTDFDGEAASRAASSTPVVASSVTAATAPTISGGNSVNTGETLPLSATGGTENVIWSSSNEAIAIVNSRTGLVTAGDSTGTVVVTATNTDLTAASATVSITVTDGGASGDTPLTGDISYDTSAAATEGTAKTYAVDTSALNAGTGNVTYTITAGAVAGITVDSATGLITVADTTAAGTHSGIEITATSDVSGSANTTVSITVASGDTPLTGDISYDTSAAATEGTAKTYAVDTSALNAGTGNVTYAITAGAVAGITVDSATGLITVADTTAAGTHSGIEITATSDVSGSANTTVSITVEAANVDKNSTPVTNADGSEISFNVSGTLSGTCAPSDFPLTASNAATAPTVSAVACTGSSVVLTMSPSLASASASNAGESISIAYTGTNLNLNTFAAEAVTNNVTADNCDTCRLNEDSCPF